MHIIQVKDHLFVFITVRRTRATARVEVLVTLILFRLGHE